MKKSIPYSELVEKISSDITFRRKKQTKKLPNAHISRVFGNNIDFTEDSLISNIDPIQIK